MSTAIARADQADSRHPMLRQLDLFIGGGEVPTTPDDDGLDVSFMSRSLCLSGLPLRKQYERDKKTLRSVEPQRECNVFSRNDDRFSLTIGTNTVVMPGGEHLCVGLPYGARARLIILWMTTQARSPGRHPGDRWLEIGRIDEWLEQIGIVAHTDHALSAKEQLVRLAFAHFTMVMKREGLEYFTSDRLTESSIFHEEDLRNYADGNLAKVRFPLGLELSPKAYSRFTGYDVIPVSTESLRKIATSAMAIDILLYLHYRLPLIGPGDNELVTWRKLAVQFGNGEPKARFRQLFDTSIQKALDAYTGANVDITEEGLLLRFSPVDARKLFAVAPRKTAGGTLQRVRTSNRIAPTREASGVTATVTEKTA